MCRVAIVLVFFMLAWARPVLGHDQNLSGLRVRLEPDCAVILVDTHRSTLGKVDPKRAVGDRLHLILDGKAYVPFAPVVGLSQDTDGVVWEDRIPHPVRSLEVVGTLYPENPKARLAVVVYDRDIAVRGAMLGPTLARWTFGKRSAEAKSAEAEFSETLGMLRERWSGYRNPWLSLVTLAAFAGAGARGRHRLAGLLAGLCAGALGHRLIGFGIADSLVEILIGVVVAMVSGAVLAMPAWTGAGRGLSVLAVALGMILGAGVGGSPEDGFRSPLGTVLDVAGTALIAMSGLSIAGWVSGRLGMTDDPDGASLRRSLAGLLLALAIGFGLISQTTPGR